tara:strand:+ start:199 stop:429 length:231 start_codon:yes stop_codon:yes gene_type:complete
MPKTKGNNIKVITKGLFLIKLFKIRSINTTVFTVFIMNSLSLKNIAEEAIFQVRQGFNCVYIITRKARKEFFLNPG